MSTHRAHCLIDWQPSILLPLFGSSRPHGKILHGLKSECFAVTCGCFSFLSFTQTASSALLPTSPRVKESSSGAVGVRAQLRQRKLANSLLQIPPIPLHSLLIPGLIIPKLWQSSAQQTSAESTLNGAQSIFITFQANWSHTSQSAGKAFMQVLFHWDFKESSLSETWGKKRVYFCKMSFMHSFAHLLFLWWNQPLFFHDLCLLFSPSLI